MATTQEAIARLRMIFETQGADTKAAPPAVGSRPIGPPAATPAAPVPGGNATGMSKDKQKSEANDPQAGGKKN